MPRTLNHHAPLLQATQHHCFLCLLYLPLSPVLLKLDTMTADHEDNEAVQGQEDLFVQEAEEDMLDDETGELDEAGATLEDLLGIGYI